MYILVLIVLLAVAVAVAAFGVARRSAARVLLGVGLAAATAVFFALLPLWGEALWFAGLGYGDRFWTEIWARVLTAGAGTLVAAALVAAAGLPVRRGSPWTFRIAVGVASVSGAVWGAAAWDSVLLFLNRVGTGTPDPILGLDAGFYLFTLPLLDRLFGLLLWLSLVAVAAAFVAGLAMADRSPDRGRRGTMLATVPPAVLLLALVLAFGRLLDVAHLLHSDWGVVAGPGWTDVHVRLPALLLVAAALVAAGLLQLAPGVRRRLAGPAGRVVGEGPHELAGAAAVWVGVIALWVLAAAVVPGLVQWLVVQPNEITFEKPYIENNIRFTRKGFRLDELEELRYPAAEGLGEAAVEANRRLLEEVRLWDWRALESVYTQFQEIRLYYEFADVDIDRYRFGGRTRQVMVSAREMQPDNLPAQSQTFVNRRFKYTHGTGLTLAPVSEFTDEGLPRLLIKDIPPVAEFPELEVAQPRIYYGELTDEPVVVNSSEQEFDRPSGEENVYFRYDGTGGVELANLWRKFVFGWMFDGTRFLLSSYPRASSRVMFHRRIRERAATVAPFLELDDDPYVVLVDGRLHWIIDAYTTSASYPYSEPYSARERLGRADGGNPVLGVTSVPALDGATWVRNSVKIVVDAFSGSVDLYVYDPDDPLIRAWQGVFPDLFKARDEMPPELVAHVRYPADFLLVQGQVYAKYHMTDPEVFYNQEDLWVRATEKYYGQVQPVEPYYVMWHPDGGEELEFVLILPFTPKNRQVLIGWIAGMCDPGSYGRFLAYKFPKERRVIGPQQVETKIDQDPYLSSQLTLWDQRGSRVIRGNVLAIPVADTLLYVEPIYLQAETAAYPELRLVVLMHGDNMAYAPSFDEALANLLSGRPEAVAAVPSALPSPRRTLAEEARGAFRRYLELQGRGELEAAGRELARLRDLLEQLVEGSSEPGGGGS